MRFIRAACYCFSLFVLSGCLVPERFSASVDVHPDGGYGYSYKGTAVHGLAAAAIKQGGALSPKDEAALKGDAEKFKKMADVRSARYTGGGRYELQIQGEKKAGEALKLFDFLTVTTDKDGVLTISSPELKEKDKKSLEQLGIKVDGTLEVRLPRNAEIISQNATSTPSFFGMFGAYSWKIGKMDQRPLMKVRLKR